MLYRIFSVYFLKLILQIQSVLWLCFLYRKEDINKGIMAIKRDSLERVSLINGTYVHLHSKRIIMLNNGTNERDYTYYNQRHR